MVRHLADKVGMGRNKKRDQEKYKYTARFFCSHATGPSKKIYSFIWLRGTRSARCEKRTPTHNCRRERAFA
jgi:hypothetical protein